MNEKFSKLLIGAFALLAILTIGYTIIQLSKSNDSVAPESEIETSTSNDEGNREDDDDENEGEDDDSEDDDDNNEEDERED